MTIVKSNNQLRIDGDRIFQRWKASLAERDRSAHSLEDNFDDLFYLLQKAKIPFEIAKEYLDAAIKAHLPDKSMVKITYRRWKKQYDSQEEFVESWHNMIHDKAVNVFYIRFQPPEDQRDTRTSIYSKNKDGVVVAPNGMSKEEYSRMRRHVESFPLIDPNNIPELDALEEDDDDLLAELESFDG